MGDERCSTGIIGAKALFPTLTALNLTAVATALAEQTSYPSWGYMLYADVGVPVDV